MSSIPNKPKQKRVYLDFASQTLVSSQVQAEMKKVAQQKNFNPANLYTEGLVANQRLAEARKEVAEVLGVKSYEIYFTSNDTLACAQVIFGVVKNYQKENLKKTKFIIPHILTSSLEHPAIYENIKYLESLGEIEATYLSPNREGLIEKEQVFLAIKPNTILVSLMYVNNEIGTIQDIKGISKKIKDWKEEHGRKLTQYPFFHTDAAQAGNYLSLYIDRLGVDMLTLNGSKIYGPKSSALLFKKEFIKLMPFYFGGGQERGLFSGTVDVERASGLSRALTLAQARALELKALEKLANKRNQLATNILKQIPEARINGALNKVEWQQEKIGINRNSRIPKNVPSQLSVHLPNFPSDEMVIRLDNCGFALASGSACSAKSNSYSRVIFSLYKNQMPKSEAIKIAQETIRITLDKSTQEKDLVRLAKVLKEIYFKYKQK